MSKILLVTDNTNVIAPWQNIIVKAGYEVDVALSGPEAIERIISGCPNLVVIDENNTSKELIASQVKQNPTIRSIPIIYKDFMKIIENSNEILEHLEDVLVKKRIIIAEDDRQMSSILKGVLESKNYDVRIANDGAETLKETKSWKPHLLVLDIMLPIIDGFHLCQKMDEDLLIDPKPKILIISGRESDWDKNLGAACGAEYYLVKPFDNAYFLEKVQEILAGYN